MKALLIVSLLALMSSVLAVEPTQKGETMSPDEKVSADSLLKEADAVFQSRDYREALGAYEKAFEVAHEEFNRSVEVEALSQMARMNLLLRDKETGRKHLADAAERVTESDPMGWSRFLGVKGRFEWQDDQLDSARQTFEQMYVFCNTNALWGRAVDAAHMIAIVATTPEEQIEWGRRGIEAAESGGTEEWLGPLWNNLAATYYDQKQFGEALECYVKSREYHWKYSGEIAKLYADYHIGMTHRLLGHFDEAASWLRPVLAWAERLGDHGAIGQACEDLGEIKVAQGNKAEGLKLLKRARDEYKLAEYDQTWAQIWDNINTRIKEVEG